MPRESGASGKTRQPRADRQRETDNPNDYPSYRHHHVFREPPEELYFGGGYRTLSGDEQKDLYGEAKAGPYVGVGPKGYKRPDERILEDVSERFMEDGHLDAHNIEVEVRSGEVTLKGFVSTRYMKRLADDLSASVLGVKDVHNQLRIKEA